MSASTEKKNRQLAREQGMDRKAQAAQEQAAKKAKERRRWAIGTVLVALLVAAVVVAYLLREARGNAAAKEKPAERVHLSVREALSDSAYRAAMVSSFANGWSSFGVRNSLLPLFAAAVLSAGPEIAGISLTAFAAGTALALTFSGKLADSWGRKPLVITGLAINGAATAAIGFSGSVAMFLVVSAIAGLGTGLLNPAQQAAVADVVAAARAAQASLTGAFS